MVPRPSPRPAVLLDVGLSLDRQDLVPPVLPRLPGHTADLGPVAVLPRRRRQECVRLVGGDVVPPPGTDVPTEGKVRQRWARGSPLSEAGRT